MRTAERVEASPMGRAAVVVHRERGERSGVGRGMASSGEGACGQKDQDGTSAAMNAFTNSSACRSAGYVASYDDRGIAIV